MEVCRKMQSSSQQIWLEGTRVEEAGGGGEEGSCRPAFLPPRQKHLYWLSVVKSEVSCSGGQARSAMVEDLVELMVQEYFRSP